MCRMGLLLIKISHAGCYYGNVARILHAFVVIAAEKLAQKICGMIETQMVSLLMRFIQTINSIPVFMIRNHFKKSDIIVFMIFPYLPFYLLMPSFFLSLGT